MVQCGLFMNHAVPYETEQSCGECGQPGAYAFEGARLCVDCYHQRGSCCAERDDRVNEQPASCSSPADRRDETLRLNSNCCYEACPWCSSVRRLREFQARHPTDWRARLIGSERLVRVARERE